MPYQPLEHEVLKAIRRYRLIGDTDRVLVALSGGLDSVVLLHLLHRLHVDLAAAHCNFQLRGASSTADADFCAALCTKLQVPYFHRAFNTTAEATSTGVSVQMAARTLRYTWFLELMHTQGYQALATGHHLNDQAETVLMNLAAGKSARSLRGIPRRNGPVIRPLLEVTREEITAYAHANGLQWQTDQSNETDHYTRNFYRHRIVPLFEAVQPAAVLNISRTAAYQQDWNLLAAERVEQLLHPCFEEQAQGLVLHLQTIVQHPAAALLLHEALAPYGFEKASVQDILTQAGHSGKRFLSPTHHLTTDRNRLLITPLPLPPPPTVRIQAPGESVVFGHYRITATLTTPPTFQPAPTNSTALLDAEKVQFPLEVRAWKNGDRFYPLGMNNARKLSDFFIDKKIPVPEKHQIPLVCYGDDILWVAGQRADNRYKVTDATRQLLVLQLSHHDDHA